MSAQGDPPADDVIRNPASGETIVIRTPASRTGGRLLAWELRLSPGGRVPSAHSHPGQEERFLVREGRMRFRVGGRRIVAGPGDLVVVPPGTVHHFANAGPVQAVIDVETRPALQMEELLRTAAELAGARRNARWSLPSPAELVLFMRDFRAEVAAPYLPVRPVGVLVAAAAGLVEKLGGARRYRLVRGRR